MYNLVNIRRQKMQINKVDNTNFGAKLNIEGYSKDIKKSVITNWEKKAKLIGNDFDTLTLKLGKPETIVETVGRFTNPKHYQIKARNVRMVSEINNKVDEKILGYYTSEKIDIHSRMISRISEYLDKLAK